MTTRLATVFLLGCVLIAALTSPAQSQNIAVVVSPNNPLSNLPIADLRKAFMGDRKSWPNGSAIKLLTRSPGTPERAALLRLMGMSETEYKRNWTAKIYRGEAESEPVTLPSNGMQKEALAVYPGGIAFVAAPDVKLGMKILKVNGKLPDEEGYPIHY